MRKTYKKMFDNICLDEKIDEIVLNKTIYKQKSFISKKIIITLSIFVLVIFTSIGIVYTEEIIKKIKSLFVTTAINFDKGGYNIYLDELKVSNKKELNFDAEFSNVKFPVLDNQQVMSFKKLKEILNIDILTPSIFENKKTRIIKLEKNNNKISYGCFAFDNIYVFQKENQKSKIDMSIEFITKFYEKDYFMLEMGQTLAENRIHKSVEFNEKLNTEVYFWGTRAISNSDENIGTLNTTFIYDDISYTLTGYNVSKNEMINILNNLEYYN